MTEHQSNKREHSSAERNELFAALAKAQGEMHTAGLTNSNPFFKSKYADLAGIVGASRPALTKNGLAIIQLIQLREDGKSSLISILGHSSGQYISSEMVLAPIKNDPQGMGSAITYARRYAYAALVGVVVSDEDDDETIMNRKPVPTVPAKLGKINQETINKLSETFGEDETIFRKFNLRSWADLNQSDLPEVIKILNT
jgi:hypothetical protein